MNPKQEYTYEFDFSKNNNNEMDANIKLLEKASREVVVSNSVNLDFDENGKITNSQLDILNQASSVYSAEKIINNTAVEEMKPVDSFEPFLDIFEEIERFKEEAQAHYKENHMKTEEPNHKEKKGKSLGMSM